ncbi:MAG: alkaline phosphatase D family protein [Hyphomonadaceae bacterium]
MLIARRGLLVASAGAAMARPAWAQSLSQGTFTHGVASGDPLTDGVIIWTRFVGDEGRIAWEVAEDETFGAIVARGEAQASPTNDFCVKIDVRGLQPGRPYHYRFLAASGPSLTGRTRTAPANAAPLSVGLVSCANYGFGYFHAYGHMAERDDIDLVLHTGDYIYEYGLDEYPRTELTVPGRDFDPDHEIISLDDYYRRYQQYHTDSNLLALRAAKPISAVWDDHEIANDSSSTGAQNHQRNEGSYADRVAAASKAYFDWMPIRRPEASGPRVYRTLDWGDLARIILLDTRLIGRVRQLNYQRALGLHLLSDGAETQAAVDEFRRTQWLDPSRTLLGLEQEAWFAETLAASKQRGQTWQVVAQQIVVGQQLVGAGAAAMVAPEAHANVRRYVTVGERLGRMGMPWNLDAWDGYPAARERFLQACTANAANAVVLGGDSHNTWLNNLTAPSESSRIAAIEFAGASVTSPGLEQALSAAAPGAREAMMQSANPDLAWCDVTNRGYGVLTFTRGACEAEWVAFANVREQQAPLPSTTRFAATPSSQHGPGAWSI